MFTTADLSLEQAPPVTVPFRFFLTAPLFAMTAAVLILIYGPEAFAARWDPAVLALTHLLTLGYLTMVMLGALMQMLPVLAGAPLPAVSLVAWIVHLALTCGTLLLAAAFVFANVDLMWGALLSGSAIGVFAIAGGIALNRVIPAGHTVTAMGLSLMALVVTAGLGLLLAAGYVGYLPAMNLTKWTGPHLFWGLAGWVAVLVIGVSYRVVPMFQVTPGYPLMVRKGMALIIPVCILGWSLLQFLDNEQGWAVVLRQGLLILALVVIAVFAAITLFLQQQRKRQVPDISLLFWRSGLICILLSSGMLIADQLGWVEIPVLFLGVLIIQGAAVSLINGMLYRIVPFLSWFHLQHRQVATASFNVQLPHMKAFIPDRAGRVQFYFHLSALLAALPGVTGMDSLVYLAAFLLFVSNLHLLVNLGRCVLKYRDFARQLESGD